MPPRKNSQQAEKMKIPVSYEEIEYSRSNALRLTLELKSNPHFIKAMQCGKAPLFEDKNPCDTATAAALLLTVNENIIVFKATKNQ